MSSTTEPDNNVVSSSYDTQVSPVMGQVVTTTDETGRQRRSVSDGFGRIVEVDEPGDSFAGTPSGGILPVNGSLRSTVVGAQNAAQATGSLSITGTEQSVTTDPCGGAAGAVSNNSTPNTSGGTIGTASNAPIPDIITSCPKTIFDHGTVTITVNGHPDTTNYGSGSTSTTVASGLASAINADAAAVVTASSSGTTLFLTAKQFGPGGDYSWSASSASQDATGNFVGASFRPSTASGALTGGANAVTGTTVWDTGAVSVSVGGFTGQAVPYGSTTAVDVRFTNDSCTACSGTAGGGDRNLFVNSITVGATTILATDPSVSYVGAPCNATSNGVASLFCNGDMDVTTSATGQSIIISAYGSPDVGVYPTMQLLVNGTVVGQWTVTGAAQNYSVNIPSGNTTSQQLAVALAATLNVPSSPVTASVPGSNTPGCTTSCITINYKSVGFGDNVAATINPAPSNPSLFPGGSFSGSTTLAGGQDSFPAGLAHPYVTRYFYDMLDNLTCIEQHGNTTGSGCTPAVMSTTDTGPPAADATSPWRIRRFAYDSFSRLRWLNDPESGLTSKTYDNNGNVLTETDARGVTINYSPVGRAIDPLNRVTGITYSDGTASVTYNYDVSCCGVTSLNPIGRLTSAVTANTELVFSYDPMGRTLTQWDCPPSGIARGFCYVISAKYDLVGQIISLAYPDGRVTSRTYNAAGRMIGVNFASFNGTSVNVPYYTVPQNTSPTAWGYYPSGNMNRGTFGNGVIETSGYGPRLQLNSTVDAKGTQTLLSKSYGLYDAANHNNGDLLSITDVLNSGRNQSYGYDLLNRIISGAEVDNAFSATFSYDPWGNMRESGTSNFLVNYDVHNRIQGAPQGCTSATIYCYDADGDLLNDGFHTYTYDAESRLKNVDGTTVGYTYNAVGTRVRKDTSTASDEYFSFGGTIIAELNPGTGAWTDYIFAYGKRIAKDGSNNGTGVQYFHGDQIGSTRLITDSAGNVIWQAAYTPFGQELNTQNGSMEFQFAGMEYDSESNLNHTEFRQYASTQGRWLSPDPYLGSIRPTNPQSLNRYIYVLNNPLGLTDPKGLDCIYDTDAAKDSNLPGPGVIRGDCLSDTDGGVFVDGHVDSVTYHTESGDLSYSATGNDQSGVIAGFYTNDNWSPDTLVDATRMLQQSTRKKDNSDLLSPDALLIFTLVGQQTGGFTKQIECAAGFAYPLIPGIKPDDLLGSLEDKGIESGSEGLGEKANGLEEAGKKLARAKKRGTAQAAREAMRKSKLLKGASHLVKFVGIGMSAAEGLENWQNCEAGKGPE